MEKLWKRGGKLVENHNKREEIAGGGERTERTSMDLTQRKPPKDLNLPGPRPIPQTNRVSVKEDESYAELSTADTLALVEGRDL